MKLPLDQGLPRLATPELHRFGFDVVHAGDVGMAAATDDELFDFAVGNNPRSAASTDGTNLGFDGAAGGIRFAKLASSTSTELSAVRSLTRSVATRPIERGVAG